jgi:uncharacterized protein YndB with AHSA1/START domain
MTASKRTSKNTKVINAPRETLYLAFLNSKALESWLAPSGMKGRIHNLDLRVGGGYEMSLYYPESEKGSPGKTSDKEDRFKARFVELIPNERIVEAITFDSKDPAFSGEMIMKVLFEPEGQATKITMIFENIPPGISPKDNEKGTESSLGKLARLVADKL